MNKFKERYLIDGEHVDKSKVVLVPRERENCFQDSDGLERNWEAVECHGQ